MPALVHPTAEVQQVAGQPSRPAQQRIRAVHIALVCTVLCGCDSRDVQRISASPTTQGLTLPNLPGSVKFAAIGDNGTGDSPEYEVAAQMAAWHQKFRFDTVIMLGDNMYGRQHARDFVEKFERPYRRLLDAGVSFYAALGNHDDPANVYYPPYHMDGRRYYSFARGDVRFFVLDSDGLDAPQLHWLERALSENPSRWKICYFHHPLYSDGRRHGSELDLRVVLEPLFVQYGVNVVYSGHDHVYERLVPQKGISYFVSGAAGQLRLDRLRHSPTAVVGYAEDQSFMLNEIVGNELFFQVVSRRGATVDSGTIHRTRSTQSTQR